MDPFLPVQMFSDWLSYSLLGLQENILGGSVNFFVYDSIKIFILLCVIVFGFAFIRTFLSPDKIRKTLSGKRQIFGNITASGIGIFTPFCTCSAIPLFMGFLESGVPLGVTFSYLIAAPMINEIAIILLLGFFGWQVALLYILSGLVISIVVGFLLGRMKLEKYVERYVWKSKIKNTRTRKKHLRERLDESFEETKRIVRKIMPYVLLGVGIGAVIHGYVPADLINTFAGKGNIFAVPIAVLIGVPLYSNALGTIPIISSLIEKGLPLGTSLAFMMAITALSLPEMIILKKVLKPKLLALYFGIVTLGIIFTGYLFNIII